ncbi:MAG: 50S ribosomal protein L22 [Dehalococcoidales bacterium]|nr:50S ribosomal protein L22 [Dehalococcoidales bacterium]
MEIRAVTKNTGISVRKIRPIVDLVRGKKVEDALTILKYVPTPHARVVSKVVKSAAANAENNHQLAISDLRIASIYADEGPTMKRYRARSRGMASPILKRSSHITVIVTEQES